MKKKQIAIATLCFLVSISGFINFYNMNSKEESKSNYELTFNNSTTNLNLREIKNGVANIAVKRNSYLVSKGDTVEIKEMQYGDVNYIEGHFKVHEVKEDSVVLSMDLKYKPDLIAGILLSTALSLMMFVLITIPMKIKKAQ